MSEQPKATESGDTERSVVLTPEGMGVHEPGSDERSPAEMVEQPAKVMRVASMIKQLLDEVRSQPLDDAGRARLAQIHQQSIAELKDGLAPELVDELDRLALPFGEGATPSDAELRIAQAQLVGWLEGLFHGIQAALVAQQMAAQNQLQQMRRSLPPGHPAAEAADGDSPAPGMPNLNRPPSVTGGTGQYL